jgi:hypothetical protein
VISQEQHQLEDHPHPGTKIFFLTCIFLATILGIKPSIVEPMKRVETTKTKEVMKISRIIMKTIIPEILVRHLIEIITVLVLWVMKLNATNVTILDTAKN